METNYTNDVFVNSKLDINKSDNSNWTITALEDIKFGELLLMEHIINSENVTDIIRLNKTLFEHLYPRTDEWNRQKVLGSGEEKELIEDYCRKKAECNAFKTGFAKLTPSESEIYLGKTLSLINHNCRPNCIATAGTFVFENVTEVKIMYLYSICEIKKGHEITISYGTKTGHDSTNTFKCTCGRNEEARTLIRNAIDKIGLKISIADKNKLNIIKKYIKSEDAQNTIILQELAKIGCYYSTEDLYTITPRANIFFRQKYGKDKNMSDNMFSYSDELTNKLRATSVKY